MGTLTPAALIARSTEALAAAWPAEVAVVATIAAVSPSRSRNLFVRLDDEHFPAVVPQHVARQLLRVVGGVGRLVGVRLVLRGRVTLWHGHQLQLTATGFSEPTRVAEPEDRAELVARLEAEGVFSRQSALPVPPDPLRVSVVGPAGAGVDDALAVLRTSPWAIHARHVESPSVDGAQLAEALGAAARGADVVLLVRGGGDLSGTCFDDEAVVRAISACPVPVVTGVGHTTDRSLTDRAAAVATPTPTAAARWVTDRIARFDAALDAAANRARDVADRRCVPAAVPVEVPVEPEPATPAAPVETVEPAPAGRWLVPALVVAVVLLVLVLVLVVVA